MTDVLHAQLARTLDRVPYATIGGRTLPRYDGKVRDYRVILTIAGRGDRLRLNMRSDPPLPDLEIVSLIAGGRTGGEIAGFRPRRSRPRHPLHPAVARPQPQENECSKWVCVVVTS